MNIFGNLTQFWSRYPALIAGISFFLGTCAHFYGFLLIIFPCLCLWSPFVAQMHQQKNLIKALILSVLLFFTAWFYTHTYYSVPKIANNELAGQAHIQIKSLEFQRGAFGGKWIYRCRIKSFMAQESSLNFSSSLPCLIIIPESRLKMYKRPEANQDYLISGKLILSNSGGFVFKTPLKKSWIPIPNTTTFAEQRYQWKKIVSEWISHYIPDKRSSKFLAALAGGQFDDYEMKEEFNRFGLQHILAISGFHFAIIASFLNLILGLFFKKRLSTLILIIVLSGYCFFLGFQSSVLRAWIMSSITLIGVLIEKQSIGLNSLGISGLIILTYDPSLCQGLAFQISYGATFSILLLYSPSEKWLDGILQSRHLREVTNMNTFNQHGYCLLIYLKKALALTLSVNFVAIPLTIYYFQQFPVMSLLYNLFFPLLVTFSVCLFILATILSVFPLIGEGFHSLNSIYTSFVLRLTSQIPQELDYYFYVASYSPFILTIYLCLIILAAIIWKERTLNTDVAYFFI